jgi:hypothetical protein
MSLIWRKLSIFDTPKYHNSNKFENTEHMVMKRILFFLPLFFLGLSVQAQVADDFSDGDFTNNPTWTGETAKFEVLADELHLNDPAPASNNTASLATLAPTQGASTWEFYARLDFNPSSSNYLRVYLQADQTDFASDLNGYYVLIGGSADLVGVYRQTGGSSSAVVTSADGTVATTPAVSVRVTRDDSGNWELFTDYAGGTNYTSEGTGNDSTHPTGNYFGFRPTYTSTRADKFYFDNVNIPVTFTDEDAPILVGFTVISSTQVVLQFNEPIDLATLLAGNFGITGGLGIDGVSLDPSDASIVIVDLANPMTNLTEYTLSAVVSDIAGNTTATLSETFLFAQGEPAEPFDVMINEIMADPTPVVGLPDAEFVELYNRSDKVIDLENYELSSGSTPQALPAYLLLPGEYVVVCDDSNIDFFTNLGITNSIAVSSFNALSNGGDNVTLTDDAGMILHSVDYTDDWYQDPVKDDGGWTLELINPDNPCDVSADNWRASESPLGGTPGAANSIFDNSTGTPALQLAEAQLLSSTEVQLTFSTAPNSADATNASNYTVDNGAGNPASAILISPSEVLLTFNPALSGNVLYTITVTGLSDCAGSGSIDPAANTATFQLPEPEVFSVVALYPSQVVQVTYELTFGTPFTNGGAYDLEIANVANTDGTQILPVTVPFIYYEPVVVEQYDLIINEVFPDPSDAFGLPEVEFVEIYNRSDKTISLEGFLFLSGTSDSDPLPFVVLESGDYIVVYEDEDGIDFDDFGASIALGDMISLTNSGDDITLVTAMGEVVDAIVYDNSWYQDSSKDDGGWTLERINPSAPCDGADNWRASESPFGGTPGQANSLLDDQADVTLPSIISAFPNDANTLVVQFTEALDPVTAADITAYSIDGGISVASAFANAPGNNSVTLSLSTPLTPSTLYTLTVGTAVTDCIGNEVGTPNAVDFALPEEIEEGDVVINEILSDPQVDGFDFVELYNNSNKIVNLGDLSIINDVATGSNSRSNIDTDYLFFPGTYVVITENPSDIAARYHVEDEDLLFKNDLPTFSPSEGNVTLFVVGRQIDKFDYYEDMHFDLLDETKGVSLERIDFNAFTNSKDNWHSAASAVGYATPTYLNSQYLAAAEGEETFTLADDTFSPDSDGFQDILRLDYEVPSNGHVVNIKVFDAKGRMVRDLVQNELLATEGFYQWDGTNDLGEKARIGIYVLWIELFDEFGNAQRFKKTCVLAGRL